MATKKTSARRKKTNAPHPVYPASALAVALRNLINMAVVMASSATVWLTLMVVKKL